MAKRFDNDFDANGFVDNFRAQDDSATPLVSNTEEKPLPIPASRPPNNPRSKSPNDSSSEPSDTVIGFIEKFLNNLKFKKPKTRYPQAGIHPKFFEKIEKMQKRNGIWGCSISTYVNAVLDAHFNENQDVIDDLINNTYNYNDV